MSALIGLPPPADPTATERDRDTTAARSPSATPSQPVSDVTLIGRVVTDEVVARRAPRTSAPAVASFGPVNAQGAPQVFLLEEPLGPADRPAWYEALLPVRPNGTKGFIPADALEVSTTRYRIRVDRDDFTLTLLRDGHVVEEYDVGIGKGSTPTPVGDYYLTSLLRPPTEGSIYGKYAYGLSGYSDALPDWEGGGVIGLHGTNDPSSVGRAVSHGCIRMRNRDIQQLVPLLPLGTPIEIK
ncbi:MAG: L,D-transpeptidase [Actinomycetota bacterium]|nr:L,D-transpeptidase [Actinomycetota bacterium]